MLQYPPGVHPSQLVSLLFNHIRYVDWRPHDPELKVQPIVPNSSPQDVNTFVYIFEKSHKDTISLAAVLDVILRRDMVCTKVISYINLSRVEEIPTE